MDRIHNKCGCFKENRDCKETAASFFFRTHNEKRKIREFNTNRAHLKAKEAEENFK